MSVTLYMLGNGFDLAHGLPTTYRDFFYFVEGIKQLTHGPDDLSKIPMFQQNLAPSTLGYLTDSFHSSTVPSYIQAIRSALYFDIPTAENLWHSLFRKKIEAKSKLDTWIDFEKEIETAVGVFQQVLFSENFSFQDVVIIYRYMGKFSFDLGKRTYTEQALIEYESEISFAIECSKEYSSLLASYRKEFILFLYHELQRYIFCLELYLRFYIMDYHLESKKTNQKFTKIAPLKEIFNKYLPDYILTFNYTDLYKNYMTYKQLSGIIPRHIHGQLRPTEQLDTAIKNRDYLHSPLVLGFHNEEKFETSEDIQFLWFEKFFQRMLCKTDVSFFSAIESAKLRSGNNIHTIMYGHSLDKTDGDFIRFIFEISSNITVYYYQESDLPQLISNLISVFDRNQVNYYYTNGILEFRPIPSST